jgi:NDP-4-keto-2,6-dideoxyhexose 3-C-methyltransferase
MIGFTKIEKCRICGNANLIPIVDLGMQYLTGVFPKKVEKNITQGPLRLVKCHGNENTCGLLQLEHSYNLSEMYGRNYGYRSGLNPSMVRHLENKVARIVSMLTLQNGDLVVDIGSNDGTTLNAFSPELRLIGVDPTGEKFRSFYRPHVDLIIDFFSADLVADACAGQKAKVVTSFSMFYDLESPVDFAKDVAKTLAPDGIWVFEQSYMPFMLEKGAYDTICHEHLEYYGLRQIVWIAECAGLKVIDVEFNEVNGGSFSVVAALQSSAWEDIKGIVDRTLAEESSKNLSSLEPYEVFASQINESRESLLAFLAVARSEGLRVCGLGASTKGNVVLQYCGLTTVDIDGIGDVNPDKFGSLTPGTWIPIISESEILDSSPDYLLVFPWHFRDYLVGNPVLAGQILVFPLPRLEVVKVVA